MDWFVKAFLRASLVWLCLGVTTGAAMAVWPVWTDYRLVHVHFVLLGFVVMMIYGVAYHVLPRFAATPLYSPRAAAVHWWLANTGLLLMASGFALRVHGVPVASPILVSGGLLSAIGAYTFAFVMWRTLGSARRVDVPRVAVAGARGGPLAREA